MRFTATGLYIITLEVENGGSHGRISKRFHVL